VNDPTAGLRERVRSGDADAFGAVFDACAKSVYNHAFRLTGDWSTAEDVMSATFLEAWRGRARIAGDGGSLYPWLLGIATNLAWRHRRASHRRRKVVEKLPALGGFPDFADDVTAPSTMPPG
jgi:DNA-directed RNA polymerase specialized sigma24 family protein